MPLSPGQVLNNRYRIVNLLGQGGMGAVYKAWDLNLKQPRALKENLDTSPEAQRQFEREAQILANLSHPNLPNVFDYFFIQGQGQYLVMEFVQGEDLDEKLRHASGALPQAQALDWIGQASAALQYLHTQNPSVIHRDIKPANIKITPQGKAILVDFGIAKVFDPKLSTTAGAKAVTPGYSPMEQYIAGQRTGPYTDIYALGATLYTLLTGQAPPQAPERSLGKGLPPLRALNPATSSAVEAAVLKAMSMQPQDRFRSAAEFAAALHLAPPQTVAVHPPQSPIRSPAVQPTAIAQPGATSWQKLPVGAWIALAAIVVGVIWLLIANSGGFWPFTGSIPTPFPTSLPAGLTAEFLPTPLDVLPTGASAAMTQAIKTAETVMQTQAASQATLPPSEPIITAQPASSIEPPAEARLGDIWTRPADGMDMVYIPAGEFVMGSANSDSYAQPDEKPQHMVHLDAYWMDQTEVTNNMFDRFVEQTGYQTTAEKSGSGFAFNISTKQWEDTQGADWRHPRGPSSSLNGLQDHPVVQVSWDDASAYCTWAGGSLPTEAQWEKAARGPDGWIFPWDDQAVAGDLLNFADTSLNVDWADKNIDDGYQFTAPVGSYPSGTSPFDLLDMAGNTWEWVQDRYGENYYASSPSSNPGGPSSSDYRVLRGGGWDNELSFVRSANRGWYFPDNHSGDLGFRCSR